MRPRNAELRLLSGGAGFREQAQQHGGNSAAAEAVDHKRLATARARCALWGGTLTVTEGDDGRPLFVISRWALCRQCVDLDEVDAFLRDVGAPL